MFDWHILCYILANGLFKPKSKTMKTILKKVFPLFLILIAAGTVNAQERPLKQYIYVIEENGNKEDYIITLYKEGPRDFTWSSPSKGSGRVQVKPTSRQNASAHLFITTDDGEIQDKTAIWVSDRIYSEFKKGKTTVDFGAGPEVLTLQGKEELETLVGGKKEKIKVLRGTTDKGTQVWIMDDSKNPILFKTSGGTNMWLKEIL